MQWPRIRLAAAPQASAAAIDRRRTVGSTSTSKARPSRSAISTASLLSNEIADLLPRDQAVPRKVEQTRLGFLPRGVREDALAGHRPRVPAARSTASSPGSQSKGVKADRWDLVALNANQELPYYYVPWLDKKEGKKPVTHAPGNCSAFIATGSFTKDGRIVMGHNAWTNYVVGTRWNIVFDINPQQGSRMIMDGLPGVIASDDDFGVNAAGIMVTETTITQFEGWDPAGKPEFVRARKALQYSRSIDDFVRIMLDGNNGGYANDWLVGDNKTGEIALFELGLKNHTVKRTKDGCFVGSNFPETEVLTREETKFDPAKKDSSPNARKARWRELDRGHKGKIDLELAKAFENDEFDAFARSKGRQRADTLRARRNLPTRRARVGLGTVLPRWHGPVEGDRRNHGRQDGVLGPGRPRRVRLPRRAVLERTQGI